jgi:hypothetical protein
MNSFITSNRDNKVATTFAHSYSILILSDIKKYSKETIHNHKQRITYNISKFQVLPYILSKEILRYNLTDTGHYSVTIFFGSGLTPQSSIYYFPKMDVNYNHRTYME